MNAHTCKIQIDPVPNRTYNNTVSSKATRRPAIWIAAKCFHFWAIDTILLCQVNLRVHLNNKCYVVTIQTLVSSGIRTAACEWLHEFDTRLKPLGQHGRFSEFCYTQLYLTGSFGLFFSTKCVNTWKMMFFPFLQWERGLLAESTGGRECLVPIPRKLNNSWMAAELSHLLYNGESSIELGFLNPTLGLNLLEVLLCPPPFLGLILSIFPSALSAKS